jgi:nitrite reductase (NADH) large subunit
MKLIVIGHGMVGHKLLECLAAQADAAGTLQVTVLGEEPRPAYDRVHLSEFFAGKSADDLSLVEPGFFERHRQFDLRLNARVASIDRAAHTVTLASGATLAYDKLVLATGSRPFVPPCPATSVTAASSTGPSRISKRCRRAARDARRGDRRRLLGLECAKALRDMGLDTHVVEFAPRLMAVQVDDGGGRMLRAKIESLGVTVHTGKNTLEIVDGEQHAHRMAFADGSHLDADMIVFSAGIRAARRTGARVRPEIGPRGGIAIDDACRTSDPTSTRSASARRGTA